MCMQFVSCHVATVRRVLEVQHETYCYLTKFFSSGATAQRGPRPPHLKVTQRHTIVGRTPPPHPGRGIGPSHTPRPDNIHETYKIQTFMPLAGFEPAVPASDRPQTVALDRSATGIGRFDPRTVHPVASCCTNSAIPDHVKQVAVCINHISRMTIVGSRHVAEVYDTQTACRIHLCFSFASDKSAK